MAPPPAKLRAPCAHRGARVRARSRAGSRGRRAPVAHDEDVEQGRTPVLIYNGEHAHPFPLVAAHVTLPSGANVPDSMIAVLKLGTTQKARLA